MPLRTAQIEEPALNLTPMIDIVFLLVIFFLVGSKFDEEQTKDQAIDITLPKSGSVSPLSEPPDSLQLTIQANGDIQLGGVPVALTADQAARFDHPLLFDRLREAKDRFPGQTVAIRGDESVTMQKLVDILAICQELELELASIVTEPDPDRTERAE